jgi:hypothetical protein
MNEHTFQYETIGNKSFLISTLENSKVLINYQLQMIINNEIPNILPVIKRQKNDDVQLCYNVTSQVSLKQAYSRNKISRDGFIKIIEGTILLLNELEEYQLVSTGLVLDDDFIFVKMGSFQPNFVYMPTYSEDLGIKPVKDFLLRLILHSKVEITNDNFIQVILDTLNSPDLTVKKLEDTIKNLNSKNSVASLPEGLKRERLPIESKVENKIISEMPVHKEVSPENIAVVPPKKHIPKKVPNKNITEKPNNPKKNQFLFVQLGLLAIIVALSLTGIINNDDGSVNFQYLMGIIIPIAGFDFILYREWFVNNKDKKSKVKIKNEKPSEKAPISGVAIPEKKSSMQHEFVRAAAPIPSAVPSEPIEIPAINIYYKENIAKKDSGARSEEDDMELTEVFEEESISTAYLEYYENGLIMKILFNKPNVVVGRMKSQVDYVINNKKVGKVHAEFIKSK